VRVGPTQSNLYIILKVYFLDSYVLYIEISF